MRVELNEYLFEKQRVALAALSNDSPARQVLYGGGVGGGKSVLGTSWQIARRLKYAGTRGLIGRAKLKALRLSTFRTLLQVLNQWGLKKDKHYTYNGQDSVLTFFNGSEIHFKDLEYYPSDPNFDSLGSTEYTDAFIDECTQVSPKARDIVFSRLRFMTLDYNIKAKLLMTCNPAKGWVYNEFYEPWKRGELPPTKVFIQSLPTDNPKLDPDYIAGLQEMMNEADKKRLLYGNWEYDSSIDRLFSYEALYSLVRDGVITDGKKYLTADVARLGKDKTVIGVWTGRTLTDIKVMAQSRVDEVVNAIRQLQQTHSIPMNQVLVDEDGIGGGVVDYLKCRGFVGGSKSITGTAVNLRSDCYYKLASLVEKSDISIAPNVGDDRFREGLKQELDATRRKNPELDGKLAIISKDDIKASIGRSPDYADMVMMRAYYELRPNYGVYVVG